MVDDNSSRQVVFSHPRAFAPGSSAAGMSYDNRHSYTIDPPVTFRGQPAPRTNSTVAVSQAAVSNTPSELFDSLIHTFLYDGVRERPRTARGRQELSSAQAWPSQGIGAGNHLEDEEQHVLEPIHHESASHYYHSMHVPSLERDEDYNHIRAFARSSLSPLSPSYSPWSTYLPNYSPASPHHSPIAYAPTAPGYAPTATAQDYAPTAPRYNPTPNTRYAPTSSTMRPLIRGSAGDDRVQPHSRSTMDYFRLLSRASDTQHRRRMREDRDRFHASAVARAGADEARATAQRSRSREGGNACPSRPSAGISPCSFLRPGMTFEGVQSSQDEVPSPAKEWSVTVEVTQVSLDTGALSGTITARNIPHQPGSVVTYFTGEVIDMLHYNFLSPEHDTDECMDWNHWNQFSAFCAISRGRLSALGDLAMQDVDSSGFVFMRWKERAFVSKLRSRGQYGSLTITGFYYICLERATGKILGSYCDPAKALQVESSHFSQQLRLKPRNQKGSGYSFGTVSFS